ncbi:hypothetical protein [Cohnella yongneupensis]|uniref:Uncharacterized protein n=1 Tax=Cohnella yongneupensis TaxID=425006 RepID=A0ABW0QW37_9BACL
MSLTSATAKNKKIITLLAVVIVCLAVAVLALLGDKLGWYDSGSSASGPKYGYKVGKFTKEDLAFYDTESRGKIYLGMTKEEAERVVGKPNGGVLVPGMFEYAGGIRIYYREDHIAGMQVINSDRYVTMRNIGIHSADDEIIRAYGKSQAPPGMDPDTYTFRDYYFTPKGGKAYEILENTDDRNLANTDKLIISFGLQSDSKMILISDLKFAQNLS